MLLMPTIQVPTNSGKPDPNFKLEHHPINLFFNLAAINHTITSSIISLLVFSHISPLNPNLCVNQVIEKARPLLDAKSK